MDVDKPVRWTNLSAGVKPGTDHQEAASSPEGNFQSEFITTVARCRGLGWHLAAMDAVERTDLGVDFQEPPGCWFRQGVPGGLLQGKVNLGVYTGRSSQLLVMEVDAGHGEALLRGCGDWRSPCRAGVNGREQHFFSLAGDSGLLPTGLLFDARIMIYGEAGLALLPPSVDHKSRQRWRWLSPPWDQSRLPELPGSLRHLIQGQVVRVPDLLGEFLSWEEIYRRIASHEEILRALLAPCGAIEDYYRNVFLAAWNGGFRDRGLLLGLLWHAPQGDIRQNPERWVRLKAIVDEARLESSSQSLPLPQDDEAGLGAAAGLVVKRSRHEVIFTELKKLSQKASEIKALLRDRGDDPTFGPPGGPTSGRAPLPSLVTQSLASLEVLREVEKLMARYGAHLEREGPKSEPGWQASRLEEDCPPPYFAYSELPQSPLQNSRRLNANIPQGYAPFGGDPRVPPAGEPPRPQAHELLEITVRACLSRHPDLANDPFKEQMVYYCFNNYINIHPDLVDLSLQERVERASQMAREFVGNRTYKYPLP